MGLEPERVVRKNKNSRRPVAEYVKQKWKEWLQTHRIELNAMTTPNFLRWLDDKIALTGQGKLIQPEAVLTKELHDKVQETLKQTLTELILKENEELKPVHDEKAKRLAKDVTKDLEKKPTQSWRDPVKRVAINLAEKSNAE